MYRVFSAKAVVASSFLFSLAVPARPELLSFGVKGGLPVTDAFTTGRGGPLGFFSGVNRYTVGPTVEFHLPAGLSIEFDALYRRLNYGSDAVFPTTVTATRVTANSWEFPLLLKGRLGVGPVHPFIAGGASFQHLSDITRIDEFFEGGARRVTETGRPAELQNRFNAGFVIGGGVELRGGGLRLSPEFRYTRWGWDNFRDVGGLLRSNQDQAAFLLGLTF